MKDAQDTYQRNSILALMLGVSLAIAIIAGPFIGLQSALVLFGFMAAAGVAAGLIIHQFMKGSANLAGGLFLGNKKKDDAAILRGMYQQAHGLQMSGHYPQAQTIYQQILADYPDQLEARFLLAQMLWVKMDRPKEALKGFESLQKKIQAEHISFKYSRALKDHLAELREELQNPGPPA